MPLKVLNHEELYRLYDKIFNPFHDIESNLDPHTQQKFESLRTDCKYYAFTPKKAHCHIDSDKLHILHLNVRSILNFEKFEAFITFLHLTGIQWDIICLSETWLNSEVDKFRNLEGYTAFFDNRSDRCGGGVAVYVRDDCVMSCHHLPVNSPTGTQSLFIQCNLPRSKVVVGQIYRPPNTCPTFFIRQLSCILDALTESSSSIILAGDFNFDLLNIDADANVESFFNMLLSYGFLPSIPLPTRVCDNRLSLLDNIYFNDIFSADTSGIIHDDLSDHFPVHLTLNLGESKAHRHHSLITSFNYQRVNDLQSHLSSELNSFLLETNPNSACRKMMHAYSSGIDRYSYTYKSTRKNTPLKPWITPGILSSINRKNELFIMKNRCPTPANTSAYRQYRNILIGIIREAKKQYIQNQLKDGNPKNTWKILNDLSKGTPEKKFFQFHLKLVKV